LFSLARVVRAAAADAAPFRHAEATVAHSRRRWPRAAHFGALTRDYIQRILDLDQGGPE